MSLVKVKLFGCLAWALCLLMLSSSHQALPASAGAHTAALDDPPKLNPKPGVAMIDRFDGAIQARFLTQPMFGINRIAPAFEPNPHVSGYRPESEEEKSSVSAFVRDGWKVSLYLFGRRAQRKEGGGDERPEFAVKYRLNRPLAVTGNVKARELPKAERLMKEVRRAFLEFQTPGSEHENSYEFSIGKWSYVARPVRASSESCLKCHRDYVVAGKVGGDEYLFRRRRVGDANGVLVYGFAKAE